MEFQGKVLTILPIKQGTSQKDGSQWASQEYVIEDSTDRYPERLVVSAFGMDKIQAFDLHIGDEVRVSFGCNAHEYQGRWYNDFRIWKVEKVTYQRQQAAPQQMAAPQPQYPPQQAQAPFAAPPQAQAPQYAQQPAVPQYAPQPAQQYAPPQPTQDPNLPF